MGFYSDAKIELLYIIPNHVRSIKELLLNKGKKEYYLTKNVEKVIYILKTYDLLEEDPTTL